MAKRNITIELSQKSIQDAIKQIEAYKNTLNVKVREFVRRLAEAGIPVIEQNMNTEGDSSTEHNVYVDLNSFGSYSRATLVLQGRDILFIEFGAGVHYNGAVGSSAYEKGAELGYTIGSYGKGHGAEDYWWYVDDSGAPRMSHGTKASMPMYKADMEIIKRFKAIAVEVFGG